MKMILFTDIYSKTLIAIYFICFFSKGILVIRNFKNEIKTNVFAPQLIFFDVDENKKVVKRIINSIVILQYILVFTVILINWF
ncbi:hypothetical protein EMA8858_00344 [Emticicia aquatica]|uniref:Uncharacterized protein n=1 Tax=Emticicia aquatica TaxID=1681835 RepID=A0ABN8EQW3_9BACT|nr:hypothetical protein EMA8858_00344 [Emticicia aquatica]